MDGWMNMKKKVVVCVPELGLGNCNCQITYVFHFAIFLFTHYFHYITGSFLDEHANQF